MNQVVEYTVTEAAIEKMKADYMSLVVTSPKDDAGFKVVHAARMVVKGTRCKVEKRRKELKADLIERGRNIDGKANRIFELLEPIETHLETQEAIVLDEQKRVKAEADKKRKEMVQARVFSFAALNTLLSWDEAEKLSDEAYRDRLAAVKAAHEQEQARLAEEKRIADEKAAAEKKAREEEAARLEVERAELRRIRQEQFLETERIRKEQDAKEAAIRAEQEATQRQKDAIEKAKRNEQERIDREAREKRIAEEAKTKAERERIEREAAEAARKAREEALRPDKEKLLSFAAELIQITGPELKEIESLEIRDRAVKEIAKIANRIKKEVNFL